MEGNWSRIAARRTFNSKICDRLTLQSALQSPSKVCSVVSPSPDAILDMVSMAALPKNWTMRPCRVPASMDGDFVPEFVRWHLPLGRTISLGMRLCVKEWHHVLSITVLTEMTKSPSSGASSTGRGDFFFFASVFDDGGFKSTSSFAIVN